MSAVQTDGGMLQKLGRVLKEKAEADLERVLNGTSKTREKLGVSPCHYSHPTKSTSTG